MMGIIKFRVGVIKRVIEVMFNNKVKVNILLYFIILALGLIIHLSIIIIMKDVNNKSSYIINYILEVPVRIEDIIIYQFFFMLKRGTNQCILE